MSRAISAARASGRGAQPARKAASSRRAGDAVEPAAGEGEAPGRGRLEKGVFHRSTLPTGQARAGPDYIAAPESAKRRKRGASPMAVRITRRNALQGARRARWSPASRRRAPRTSRPTASRRSAISRCRPISNPSPMSTRTRPRAACCRCRSPRRPAIRTSRPSTRSISSRRKGNGAAGMGATFDTLMTGNGDEPDSVYGLVAQSVRDQRRQAAISLPAAARGALLRRLASSPPPTSPSR